MRICTSTSISASSGSNTYSSEQWIWRDTPHPSWTALLIKSFKWEALHNFRFNSQGKNDSLSSRNSQEILTKGFGCHLPSTYQVLHSSDPTNRYASVRLQPYFFPSKVMGLLSCTGVCLKFMVYLLQTCIIPSLKQRYLVPHFYKHKDTTKLSNCIDKI